MKTTINVNNKTVEFQRNWVTGSFSYTIDGHKRNLACALNPFTHLSLTLSKTYKAQAGEVTVTIVKTRPMLFAGFRPHNYKFFINNDLIKEVEEL